MKNEHESRIETRVATIELPADGIVRVTMRPGATVTLDDARDVIAAGGRLVDGEARPFVTDISDVRAVGRDARMHFASDAAARNCRASAVVVGSPVSRAIGNFFLGMNRPPFPVRLFTSESEALAWLAEIAPSEG